ncbi:ankyrin repeat domain-containing protein [bacterium]|nr:ankyrin repeat domain-containing protein [bacterium]
MEESLTRESAQQCGIVVTPKELLAVIKSGNSCRLSEILESPVDLNQQLIGNKSYLHVAAELGQRHISRLLVRYGANVNEVRGKRQHSLLHTAVIGMNFAFASILIELGADVSAEKRSMVQLHYTSPLGQISSILLGNSSRTVRVRRKRIIGAKPQLKSRD